MHPAIPSSQPLHFDWPDRVPEPEWTIYEDVIRRLQAKGIDFALGGAVALGAYTGQWRNTKDMDLYIVGEDRDVVIAALSEAGLQDYFGVKPYDRRWIYRSYSGDTIVDVIWAMANQRARVDREWIRQGPVAESRGLRVRVLPPEELIWSKLYVLQRERCDWPDVLNILDATGPWLDWDRLFSRVGDDSPLLGAVICVYRWLCPAKAAMLPQVDPGNCVPSQPNDQPRQQLLDTRPWFRGAAA